MGGAPDCLRACDGIGSVHRLQPEPSPTTVNVVVQPKIPSRPRKLSVFVFEDDFPLNGEQDGGGRHRCAVAQMSLA